MSDYLANRPIIIAVAGPNGAGRNTFVQQFLNDMRLRFVNADVIARELELDPYEAARMADAARRTLVAQRESFIFETVFSDPVGDKAAFLHQAIQSGYAVALCYIGISSPDISEQRVALRVSRGGHDVPSDKLVSRFPRTLANLRASLRRLPHVRVYDNDDARSPYRLIAVFENGELTYRARYWPEWMQRAASADDLPPDEISGGRG